MIVAQNEFSKTFKIGDIDMYLAKAVDDEHNVHFLVVSIPKIEEVNASEIQYPINFDTDKDRDEAFKKFDLAFAMNFIDELITFMKEQNEKQK